MVVDLWRKKYFDLLGVLEPPKTSGMISHNQIGN